MFGRYQNFCRTLYTIYITISLTPPRPAGTFAVTCIMTGKVVSEYSVPAVSGGGPAYDPVLVATTVTLAVGIVQVRAR